MVQVVSFDIFFQRFERGGAALVDMVSVRSALGPFAVSAEESFVRVATEDGGADIYGLNGADGFMANHVEGRQIWDLLVEVSIATDLVIMPIGCPICLTSADQTSALPEDLRNDTVVVTSGADLLTVIAEA